MKRIVLAATLASFCVPSLAFAGAPTYVVVAGDQDLYRAPKSRHRSQASAKDFLILKRVGEKDGWVQVEHDSGMNDGMHCHSHLWGLAGLSVVWWVPKDALETITTKPVRSDFPDGTFVEVPAGTVVRKASGGAASHRALTSRGALPFDVEPAALGTSYIPRGTLSRTPGTSSRLDGALRIAGVDVPSFADAFVNVTRSESRKGGDSLLQISTSCYRIGAVGKTHDPTAKEQALRNAAILGTLGALSGGAGEAYFVAKGTELRWDDSTLAGRTLREVEMGKPIAERDGQSCHSAELRGPESSQITLCVPKANVRVEKRESVFGAMTGGTVGDALSDGHGFGGLGLRGTGTGGGGVGFGTIGGLGTKGTGKGVGTGTGLGTLGKSGGGKVTVAKPTVRGSLDKEVVRRVIRRHLNQVRYCYEKALVKNPKLEGKIAIKFTISSTGAVAASSVVESTLKKGDEVEACVARVVKRMTFPKPEGGGIVLVTYPFVFNKR